MSCAQKYDVCIIGGGICRGLSQSGAMGIYVADCITEKA